MSIPNIFTLTRILLTPVFVIFMLRGKYHSALFIFTVAGITDGLDGLIARCLNQRTTLGAYLDPIADKLLLVSAYVTLAVMQVIPEWPAVAVISRDVIIILGIATFTLLGKKYKVQPSLISKFTTTAQIVTILLCLFDYDRLKLPALHFPVLWIMVGLTILSGLHYIYIGMRILQEPNYSNDMKR
ncbi:MAG: CDP-diacylglycerol--glycerol-3-phosphate 3-phosphatidyltransferase [Desulfobacteraceae bacterium]|nr:CDP-diacylglycerol--glycerol-3-phosphate 3-phosphatidyltransferase [Desulfobacteraceae bacterium]